jgi:hypothetical protein
MSTGGRGLPYLPEGERLWAWANHSQWAYSLVTKRYGSPNLRHDRDAKGIVLNNQPSLTLADDQLSYGVARLDNLHLARSEELMRILYSPWPTATLRQVHGVILKSFWAYMACMDATRRGIAGPSFPCSGHLTWGWRIVDYRWVRDQVINEHGCYTLDLLLQYHDQQPPETRSKYRYKTRSRLVTLWGLLYSSGM